MENCAAFIGEMICAAKKNNVLFQLKNNFGVESKHEEGLIVFGRCEKFVCNDLIK